LISYAGESKEADLTVQNPSLDLVIQKITDIDLSQILGFPMEVTSYQKQPDHTAIITGKVVLLNNAHFIMATYGTRLAFTNLKITRSSKLNPQGIPYAEPVAGSVSTDNFQILLRYHYGYRLKQISEFSTGFQKNNPLKIYPGKDGNGFIRGRTYIEKGSFQMTSALLDYTEGQSFYLYDKTASSPNIITLTGKGVNPPVSEFALCSSSGGDMKFKFLGFSSIGHRAGSLLKGDSLVLNATLTSKLQGNLECTLDANRISMTTSLVRPVEISQATVLKLGEKWKISADKFTWTNGQNGFKGSNAMLRTGFAYIPVKQMKLTANDIQLNDFIISGLKIGNVAPISIKPDAECLFYYDPKVGEMGKPHYVVKIISNNVNLPVANLKNLPGMKAGTQLDIGSIQVLDNDEQLYAGVENSPELLFHDVFHLKVNQITSHETFFTLTGIYDIRLPRIPNYNRANLNFFLEKNILKLNMDPLPLEFTGPGNVFFKANQVEHADTLFPGYFECKGKLTFTDKGFSKTLDARLTRNTSTGYVMVYPETQMLLLSSTPGPDAVMLKNVKGSMLTNSSDWDFFWFKGIMANTKNTGEPKETEKFFVKGSISSDGNSIKADNIETPLGNLKMSYDLEKNILNGSLVMNELPMLGFTVSGAAEMEFGSKGWYLCASVNMISSQPMIGQITAGLAFGSHSQVPATLKSTVLLNAKNKLWPSNMDPELKGFFFTAYKSLFPPISSEAGFSLGGYWVGYKVNVDCGFDSRFGMNFLPGATTLDFGLMAYGNATAYLGGYMGAICPYINGSVHVGIGIPDGFINFSTGKLKLHGQNFTEMGIESGVCLGPFCSPCLSMSYSKKLIFDLIYENQPSQSSFTVTLE
ncbi:MAG: hypothetical protein ACM3N9_00205, partial [Syntrophothermus sp.]